MARSKSSHRWLKEHFGDQYVKKSRTDGYRSRAVYKLDELDRKYGLLKPGRVIVDLGAAPGGWSQLAIERVGGKGRVFALDILPMEAIDGVEFIQGDFREESVLKELVGLMGDARADLVLSDMAPNLSGVEAVDQPRSIYLAELAMELADQVLAKQGDLLVKVFQGEGFDPYLSDVRKRFAQVMIRKPDASRDRSREVYILGRGFKGV